MGDLRHALGAFRRSLSFAVAAVLTLGLGIGVLTALFAVVDAVLLRPIAPDQDRVVRIWKQDVERGLDRDPLSYPEFLDWRRESRSFQRLAAINYADRASAAIVIDDRPARVAVTPVSSDFFAVLHGGDPLFGRWFRAADEHAGAELAVVVSEAFWRRAAGANPGIVGRRLQWAGTDRTLIVTGIAPAALDYPPGTDMWIPLVRYFGVGAQAHIDVTRRRAAQFELLGQLADGVSVAAAEAELTALDRRLGALYPDDYRPLRIVLTPILDTVVGNSRQVLLVLSAAAALVFIIAGVNVATLLLMRAAAMRRELAVRVALGATWRRLARAAMTESLLLSALGVLAGLVLAHVFLGVMRQLAPAVPRIEATAVNFEVVSFCGVAAFAWALALGTSPVWGYRRLDGALRAASVDVPSVAAPGARALRLFAIAQIAAAVVVAIGAGLLVRSFMHLQDIDRGFDSKHVAVIPLLLPDGRYPDAGARLAYYEQLLPKIATIPGVISASPLHIGPGTGTAGLSAGMMFEGQRPAEADKNPWASWEPVVPSYFRTLGIPIVRGRGFTDADSRSGAPVAIVSDAVARRYWPGQDPIGKRLRFTSEFPWVTVVGVAADVRYRELTRTWMTVYFPAAQFFFFLPGSLVVRTGPAPEDLMPAIRDTIRAQDPYVPFESISRMDTLLARELARPRTAFTVAALFALMAIVLAAVGVFGVLSYELRQRRRELAVRSALGASPPVLFRAVVLRSLSLGAVGAATGLASAALVTRWVRSLLFEVGPADPEVFIAAAATLLAIVLAASYLPARRAASIDPVVVLRAE